MTNSGDAAEQIVRMSLEGTEVALKLSGSAAKNIAAALYTIAKNADRNKTKGHQRLSAMLKSGKELKVFTISEEHLKRFAQEAKRYGVVYCALRGKERSADGMVDVMVRAEDAAKVNRIFTRFGLATVDMAAVKTEIVKEQEKGRASDAPAGSEQSVDDSSRPHNDDFVKELFSQSQDFVEENPQNGRTKAESPSGNTLPSKWDEGISSDKRPSVREALKQIRQEQAGITEQPQHTIAEKVVEKIAKGKER